MFVLGLDIGYSNFKMAYGHKDGEMKTKVMPVGAGPLELMPQQLNGSTGENCVHVIVDEEKWVAGVEPDRLQGWERELHEDYPSTKPYMALFYASLLMSEVAEIDVVVTGLPVNQFMDAKRREELEKRLTGEHQVTPKRKVTVKSVVVVPQPVGAYMDIVSSQNDEKLLEVVQNGKVIVIDPGFFSVDWVALEEGEIRYHSSGTSLKAMSMLLSETDRRIQEDHGGSVKIEKLEKTIRAGNRDIFMFGEKVNIEKYFEEAAAKISHNALVPMRKSMREEGMGADVVLLAGGGASAYKNAADELFPKSTIITPSNAVVSNARGFWFCG